MCKIDKEQINRPWMIMSIKKVPKRRNQEIEFDILEDILETLRFRGTIFFRSKLASPWGITLASAGMPRFHIMLSGDCFVGIDRNKTIKIQERGIIMLPTGHSHWIADKPGRKLVSGQLAGKACALGKPLFQHGKISHHLMCGLVSFDQDMSHPFLDSFPKVLNFPGFKKNDAIWVTVTAIESQMRSAHGNSGPVVDRLTEALFLQLLSHYIHENKDTTGFFAALNDRRIHRVLTLIHQKPDCDWSLSLLVDKVGMSRATLVRHFQDCVGMAPMAYVTNWRIIKTYNQIKYTTESLDRIAQSVGFTSGRTLNKVFQRHYGYTPTELRREHRSDIK